MSRPHLVVEEEFTTKAGYRGVITMSYMGHRCGYCFIPENHVYNNFDEYATFNTEDVEDESEIPDERTLAIQEDINNISVHGGLTHAGILNSDVFKNPKEGYSFGFDCAHSGDAKDAEAIYDLGLDRSGIPMFSLFTFSHINEVIRTKEYVHQEIENLSDQLEEIQNKYKEN